MSDIVFGIDRKAIAGSTLEGSALNPRPYHEYEPNIAGHIIETMPEPAVWENRGHKKRLVGGFIPDLGGGGGRKIAGEAIVLSVRVLRNLPEITQRALDLFQDCIKDRLNVEGVEILKWVRNDGPESSCLSFYLPLTLTHEKFVAAKNLAYELRGPDNKNFLTDNLPSRVSRSWAQSPSP